MRENLPEGSRVLLLTLEKTGLPLEKTHQEQIGKLRKDGIELLMHRYFRFGFLAMLQWGGLLFRLRNVCARNKVDAVHAFGTPAGAAAYLLCRMKGLSLVLDSFEPHAESMVENGEWDRSGFAFHLLFQLEKKQASYARCIIGVTGGMKDYTKRILGVDPVRFYVKPACVDQQEFDPSPITEENAELKRELGLEGKKVCIYAGKIGGIYLKEEVFEFFAEAVNIWGDDFRALLLTDASHQEIGRAMKQAGVAENVVLHRLVPYDQVPAYMKLADFAINPVKPVPSKRYCTSIKDGEYWAMGLPVVIPPGISSDSCLIREKKAGAVLPSFDPEGYRSALKTIEELFRQEDPDSLRERIRRLSHEHRDFSIAEEVYSRIYGPDGRTGRIAFICYWELNDPLTTATVFPHLERLLEFDEVKEVDLYTIERKGHQQEHGSGRKLNGKVRHIPVFSRASLISTLTKLRDYRDLWNIFKYHHEKDPYDLLFCRSSFAGVIGLWAYEKYRVPYVVESFEPHADYMKDSGQWKPGDPRFIILRYYEKRQKQSARYLLPVADNYSRRLQKEGVVGERLQTLPCTVSVDHFRFSRDDRDQIRKELRIPESAIVGVYVGKFGGIYYEKETVILFQKGFEKFGKNFYLIVLTPFDQHLVQQWMEALSLPMERVHITRATHDQVPAYLSAADLGYAPIRKKRSNAYCSPVKNGEYWANGIPVLLTEGVGDDASIVEEYNCGATFTMNEESIMAAYDRLERIIREPEHRERICREVAQRFRSQDRIGEVYSHILKAERIGGNG